jgi:hypothetical protein
MEVSAAIPKFIPGNPDLPSSSLPHEDGMENIKHIKDEVFELLEPSVTEDDQGSSLPNTSTTLSPNVAAIANDTVQVALSLFKIPEGLKEIYEEVKKTARVPVQTGLTQKTPAKIKLYNYFFPPDLTAGGIEEQLFQILEKYRPALEKDAAEMKKLKEELISLNKDNPVSQNQPTVDTEAEDLYSWLKEKINAYDRKKNISYEQHKKHLLSMHQLFETQVRFFDSHLSCLIECRDLLVKTDYGIVLEKELTQNHSSTSKIERKMNQAVDLLEHLNQEIETSLIRYKKIEEEYQRFEKAHKKDPLACFKKSYKLLQIYWLYLNNPDETLKYLLEFFNAKVKDYVIHHPSKQTHKMMCDLYLSYKLLNGQDTNLELLSRYSEKTLLVLSFMRGFSTTINANSLEDDLEMPPAVKVVCEILEMLPKAIALFEGMKDGSSLPLLSLSLFAEAAHFPYAWAVPLANVALGGWENLRNICAIQTINEHLSEERLEELIRFTKTLDQKFSDTSELYLTRLRVAAFRETIDAEKRKPTTHIFQRVAYNTRNFTLKIKLAPFNERVVRLICQVGVPAVIMQATIISILAALIGLAPSGILIISAIYASIATLAAGSYAAFEVSIKLGLWIDECYGTTVRKVHEFRQIEENKQNLLSFKEHHRGRLDEIIQQTYTFTEEKVNKGAHDEFLQSDEFKDCDPADSIEERRRKFLIKEKIKISTHLEAAAFVAYDSSTSARDVQSYMKTIQDLGESWDVINSLIKPLDTSERMFLAHQEAIEPA